MAIAPRRYAFLSFTAGLVVFAFATARVHADDGPQPAPVIQANQSSSSSSQSSSSSMQTGNPASTQTVQDQNQSEKKKNDRMFYVMPNFLTVENEAQAKPLRWQQKFSMTAKGVFDPYEFITVGVLAGIRQAENAYPGFGQGAAGYGKRYGTAMADQVDGNFMVGAIFPTVLKTDPRYFQLGHGGFWRRFTYAFTRVFVARKDSGGHTVNLSEPLGNGVAIGISNFYYPAADRSFSSNINDWGVQMGIDAFGNELKEFWPDIHRRLSRKKQTSSPADLARP